MGCVVKDYEQADYLYRKAEGQECVMAQVDLWNCYCLGRGLPSDELEAHD